MCETTLSSQMTVFICTFDCLYLLKSIPFGLLKVSLESIKATCQVCGSPDEEKEEARCDQTTAANGSTPCSCPDNIKRGRNAHRHLDFVVQLGIVSSCFLFFLIFSSVFTKTTNFSLDSSKISLSMYIYRFACPQQW